MRTIRPKYRKLCVALCAMALLLCGAVPTAGWISLQLKDHAGHLYRASSELQTPTDNTFGRYAMHRLFDNDLKTCWAEGTPGPGIGETLYIVIPFGTPSFSMANGYQKSRSLFRANNRVKIAKLALWVGISREGELTESFTLFHTQKFSAEYTVFLQDIFGFQQMPLPFDWQRMREFKNKVLAEFKSRQIKGDSSMKPDVRYILQLTIIDVYKSNKYDDTCVSEIKFNCVAPAYPTVKKVYVNPKENTLYMDTQTASGIVLDHEPAAVFQIIDTSADRQWVIAIRMPAETGDSRVETTYELYNTRLKRRVPAKILGPDVGEMYDFERAGETIYLNYLNNKTGEIERLDLNAVYRRLAGSN